MKKAVIVFIPVLFIIGFSAFTFRGNVKVINNKADSVLDDRKHYVDELRLQINKRFHESFLI